MNDIESEKKRYEEYEELRKFLGSLHGKVLFEWNQNKKVYIFSIVGFILSMSCILLLKTANNPMLSMIFIVLFVVLFISTTAIKKANIENFPSNLKKIEEFERKYNNNFIDEFTEYLESILRPREWCNYFPMPSNSQIMFNLFFSGLFTFFVSSYNLWFHDTSQDINQIYLSTLVIIAYSIMVIVKQLFSIIKPNDFETTVRALRAVNQYNIVKSKSG